MAVISLQAESVRTNPHAYFWARHREYEAAQGRWLADDGENAETDTRLSDAAYAAEDDLFTTPALSVAGVLAKARVLLLRDDAMATLHSRHVVAMLADLQRRTLIEAAREGATMATLDATALAPADAAFWGLHSAWRGQEDAVSAKRDEEWTDLAERATQGLVAMLAAPVASSAAIVAKLDAIAECGATAFDMDLAPKMSVLDAIRRDVRALPGAAGGGLAGLA